MVGGGQGGAFLTVLSWLFIALLVAVPSMAVLRATIVDGTLSFSLGLCLLLGLIMGSGMMLRGGGTALSLVAGLILLLGCGAWPLLSLYADKSGRRRLQDDDIERLESAIAFDPDNAGAHAGLGEKLADLKRIDEAIHEYRMAIQLLPDGAQTKRWKSDLRTLLDAQNGIDRYDFQVCRSCHCDLPRGTKTCPKCGEVQNMNFFEWSSKRENLLPSLRDSALATLAIFVVLSALMVLPIEIAGCLVMSSILVGGWFVLQAMKP
jgi:tetratricopeptide (TPR) repeat protein